jgi:tetratricopeptide (TPR) repeat protein
MPASSKRLAYLEKVTEDGSQEPLAWYGLALEYRTLERHDEALQTFTTLRTMAPEYVPMYLMCGQMLEKLGRRDDAREWLEEGIRMAKTKRDTHALGELEAALGAL